MGKNWITGIPAMDESRRQGHDVGANDLRYTDIWDGYASQTERNYDRMFQRFRDMTPGAPEGMADIEDDPTSWFQ